MKHVKCVTVSNANVVNPGNVNDVLDRVFAFILNLANQKGKTVEQPTS